MDDVEKDVDARNRETSAREVRDFKARTEPVPYTAYLSSDGKRITTWMGETLATIASVGKPAQAFGNRDKLTPFRAIGIDGRVYYGRHNGPSMSLVMRPLKVKS